MFFCGELTMVMYPISTLRTERKGCAVEYIILIKNVGYIKIKMLN